MLCHAIVHLVAFLILPGATELDWIYNQIYQLTSLNYRTPSGHQTISAPDFVLFIFVVSTEDRNRLSLLVILLSTFKRILLLFSGNEILNILYSFYTESLRTDVDSPPWLFYFASSREFSFCQLKETSKASTVPILLICLFTSLPPPSLPCYWDVGAPCSSDGSDPHTDHDMMGRYSYWATGSRAVHIYHN